MLLRSQYHFLGWVLTIKIPSQPLDIFVSWSKYLLTFWEHLIVESFFQGVKISGEHYQNCLAFQNVRQTSNERNLQCTSKYGHLRISQDICHVRTTDIEGFLTIYGHSDNLLNNKCIYTVWQNFCGSLILRIGDFCVLREIIFAIWKDWFFLLGINFCDSLKVVFWVNYH